MNYKEKLDIIKETTIKKIAEFATVENKTEEMKKEIMRLSDTAISYKMILSYIEKNKDNIMGYIDETNHFVEVFNKKNGFYFRTGVIENNFDTGKDPFMRDFPQLIDVGIMGWHNGPCKIL